MEKRKGTSLAVETRLAQRIEFPEPPRISETDRKLEIVVIFTSTEATTAALKKADSFANRLNAHITLIVLQVVSYHLPLESPPIPLDFSKRLFRKIAGESSVETAVRLYLCRDRLETLTTVLRPRSLVIVGGHTRWWPTREKGLVRKLRRAGHEVIVTEVT
jgi:hypothetical protein